MEPAVAKTLISVNTAFYRENHASFSASRRSAWPGWNRVAAALPRGEDELSVLDVACGTMRFERFLLNEFPQRSFSFVCVDACPQLAQDVEGASFVEDDVLARLLKTGDLAANLGCGFDAAVSFGFMHHIPGYSLRESFVRRLAGRVRRSGLIALSFWRFMDAPDLARKAEAVTERFLAANPIELEQGDYLLGWDGRADAYRYCHHFDEAELAKLVQDLADVLDVRDRFAADGRNRSLNAYLVFARR